MQKTKTKNKNKNKDKKVLEKVNTVYAKIEINFRVEGQLLKLKLELEQLKGKKSQNIL